MPRAGGSQISGDRLAKLCGTHRVAVVERAGAHPSRMTRDQIRPCLEGKVVKCQLAHAERARTVRPWRTLAAGEKCGAARDRARTRISIIRPGAAVLARHRLLRQRTGHESSSAHAAFEVAFGQEL